MSVAAWLTAVVNIGAAAAATYAGLWALALAAAVAALIAVVVLDDIARERRLAAMAAHTDQRRQG